jgi:hypothetical protein
VGSPARAERRTAGHESRNAQPGRRQSASGQSASGQSASGQYASGMMRRSLPQALLGAGPPVPRPLVTVTASPGP